MLNAANPEIHLCVVVTRELQGQVHLGQVVVRELVAAHPDEVHVHVPSLQAVDLGEHGDFARRAPQETEEVA